MDDDISARGKGTGIENFGAPDEINAGRFMNMTGDAELWLVLNDKLSNGGAANRRPIDQTIKARGVRGGMTHHELERRISRFGVGLGENDSKFLLLIF